MSDIIPVQVDLELEENNQEYEMDLSDEIKIADITLAIGDTVTGEPGTDADVENTGTDTDIVLKFTIPRGADGADGQDGKDGQDGAQGPKGDKGDKGDTGATGATGPQGPQGATGPAGADGDDGEDGVSPEVTITTITGGHRVTITDAEHPSGQSFDVMDGSSGSSDAETVYCVCSTVTKTKDKVVSGSYTIKDGCIVNVYFTKQFNRAYNTTLQVGAMSAMPILYPAGTTTWDTYGPTETIKAGDLVTFVYDATNSCYYMIGHCNALIQHESTTGYGTCDSSASSTTKQVTMVSSNFTNTTGAMVTVKFTYAVPAGALLNIGSYSPAIYYKGAAITAGIIGDGDTATFVHDGTHWNLISVDKSAEIVNGNAIAY